MFETTNQFIAYGQKSHREDVKWGLDKVRDFGIPQPVFSGETSDPTMQHSII